MDFWTFFPFKQTWITFTWTVIRCYMVLWVVAFHLKSLLFQFWCLEVFWKWIFKVFILTGDIAWPNDYWKTRFGKLVPPNLCRHCVKFDAYRSSGSWYVMFLFCRGTSRDHMIKEMRDLISESPSKQVTSVFDTYMSYGCGDITFLIWHVKPQDCIIKGSCGMFSWIPSLQITTLLSLLVVRPAKVEM